MTHASASPSDAVAPKAQWHAPTMEQVEYSATESSGAGGTYDFIVYTGSTP